MPWIPWVILLSCALVWPLDRQPVRKLALFVVIVCALMVLVTGSQ